MKRGGISGLTNPSAILVQTTQFEQAQILIESYQFEPKCKSGRSIGSYIATLMTIL